IGDRPFLRFVPADPEAALVTDTLGCLRLVTCEPRTERTLVDEVPDRAYAAWERARQDIYEAWTFATDPKNLQPKIRPLFRRIAEHLRQHPPTEMTQDALDRIVESVEAPWGMRHERALREEWDRFEGGRTEPAVMSAALVEKIRELGLQPFKAPEALDPIDEQEIKLVCWMVVTAGSEKGKDSFRLEGEDQQLEIR
ncbi:MAG: hypothetical protein ACREMD_02900, partial [Gemmatimonadota bacterium]